MLQTDNRGRFAIGVLSLALPVLLLWRCAARPESSPNTPVDTTPSTQDAPPAAAPSAALPSPTTPEASVSASTATPVPTPGAPLIAPIPSASSSAKSSIIAAVAGRDARDLALLSRIERELKRDPPAAVHALIRLREGGASRSQLIAEAEKQLPRDVALRVLVRRWIEEVAPDGSAAPKNLGPVPSGTHEPLVKPIERAKTP